MPLYARTLGSGTDVVLLHGWGMHSGVWEEVVEDLLDHYRITLLDLPGHGYSRTALVGDTLAEWTAAVLEVVPQRAVWAGWSLGGLIAQHAAVNTPQRVHGLVLVNSSPCFVQHADWAHGIALPVLRRFAEELSADYQEVLQRFIALEVYGSAHASAQLRQLKAMVLEHGAPELSALQDGLAILESGDLRATWAQIACPILLLLGQRDQLVPASVGAALCQALPHAVLHIFPNAGHAPFLSQRPAFIAQLRAFIDERC